MDTTPSSTAKRSGVSWVVVSIGFVLVLVGALLFAFGWKAAEDARASESWPTVTGRVVSSEVRVSQDSEGSDSYDPAVAFVYVVDGVQHRSTRVAFGVHNSGDEGGVRRTVARYPVGEPVEVAYDPADNGRAVLEPGEEGVSFVVQLVGIAVGVSGLLMVVLPVLLAVRRRRKASVTLPPSSDPSSQPFIS